MTNQELNTLHKTHKEFSLFGRYIHTKNIEPLLQKLPSKFKINSIGKSVKDESIYSITVGSGPKKVLMWSQMHGNESTTTKAIFDLFNVLSEENEVSKMLLKHCTLKIIPILNPDGAKAYTRLNANGVDLNRDSQNLSQPESKVLRDCFDSFMPDFCFNLHGQRTIFSAGKTDKAATVSFLSPAQDKACTITSNRKQAMSLIVKMNNMLQQEIPNKIGVYDDTFNINCVGDTFQSLNVPTVLFEAGHYKNDYNREEVRRFVFQSLIVSLQSIASDNINEEDCLLYLNIPENDKLFYDIIIRNAKNKDDITDIAIQYSEQLIDNELNFIPIVEKIVNLDGFYAHKTINANNNVVLAPNGSEISLGNEIDFVSIENEKFSLKL